MFISYPKTKSLYKLEPIAPGSRKWGITDGSLLPDTAALHVMPMEDLVFTEKIDGTNMGVLVENGKIIHIQKRNNVANPEDKNDQFYFEQGLIPECFPKEFSGMIFGELHGPKIQKGGVYSSKREFRMFDILSMENKKFFTWDALVAMEEILGIPLVPELEYPYEDIKLENISKFVTGLQVYAGGSQAEGVVVRYRKDTSMEKRWIAKIRNCDLK